jgi:antirestriction protein ArdC
MKVEEIKQLTTKALDELLSALESGHSETLTAYLKAMAKFSNYSLHNLFLIAMQRPDACRVAGYQTWRKLGRYVKKGEKGIAIIAPVVRRKANAESESTEQEEKEHAIAGFTLAHVFAEQQTDGNPLPEIGAVNGNPSNYFDRLAEFIAEQGIALEYSEDIAPAKGTAIPGKITLLPGQTPAELFSTCVHELAHCALHQSARRSETTKRIRETEAEAVAFVVSNAIGLETGTSSADYIGLYTGDAKLLADSLEFVRETANRILTAITFELPAAPA